MKASFGESVDDIAIVLRHAECTVAARPIDVRPTMTTPSRSKWASHLSSRGLNSRTSTPLSDVHNTLLNVHQGVFRGFSRQR